MSRLFIGNIPSRGPCLKIMANDTDDPRTTPNDDWWKFRFNSETAEIGYVKTIAQVSFNLASLDDDGDYHYYPSGTGDEDCTLKYRWFDPKWLLFWNVSEAISTTGDFVFWPACDASTWSRLYYGAKKEYFSDGDYLYWFGRVQPYQTTPAIGVTTVARQGVLEAGSARHFGVVNWEKDGSSVINTFNYLPQFINADQGGNAELKAYVTDLPIDESDYPAVVGSPASGLKIVRIDPNNAKVAKPGFSVDSASDAQLILGHSKPPLLVARTGSFTLAAGATQSVTVDLPITPWTLVDYQVNKTGQPLYLPAYPDNDTDTLEVQYRIVGQQVQFKNPIGISVDVRFFVMAADERGITTGGGKVLDTSGGFIRILRPGASANPNTRDILVDSRATYLPLVAQGWVPNSAFSSSGSYLGNRTYRVNLAAGSYKPFVIARSKNDVGNGQTFYADFYGKQISIYDYMSASTFLAKVTSTYIDFYANTSARSEDAFRYGNGYGGASAYSSFLGMRYYVFAVPNSL